MDSKIKFNKIYNLDCEVLIKKMIDEGVKVDLIITDPPYNASKKNNFRSIGRFGIDFGEWDKNFDQTNWLKNINKIIKDGGSIIIFNNWKNLGLISQELENQGFQIKDIIRWIKTNPMPRNVSRRYVTDYEFAIWATSKNGKWTFNKPDSKYYLKPEFTSSIVSGKNRIHPTEKSLEIIEEIIKIHSNEGDIIFDPFSGSGVISYAANKLNRFYIATEISKVFFEQSIKRIKDYFIKPTFNHLGNKYRMIEDLIRNFPKHNIDYFVDAFAGSGVVSLNYQSPKKIFLNDNDKWLTKVLDYLMNTNYKIIIEEIENIIKKYKLPIDFYINKYNDEYNLLKSEFNTNPTTQKLLVLILFGFNQQIRFNSEGKWNIPAGKFYWNNYHKNKLIEFCQKASDRTYSIHSKDFQLFVNEILSDIDKEKTFFYFDPPYLITNATYNRSWTEIEERKLINLIQSLLDKGYKWSLSNVLRCKGKTNKILLDFINKNIKKIKIDYISNITYKNSNYQRNNNEEIVEEILIRGNYE